MITEVRESRTTLLHKSERRHRRHHTLDNSTLDKFNFICVPLNLNKTRNDTSSSQSNVFVKSTNELPSPTRRVRFKFDENQERNSISPKKYSVHRVEFQIPVHRDTNSYLTIDCSPKPAKTRSITSQKIDINHKGITVLNDFPTLSAVDSDKWYKEMYGQIHKSSGTKKDVILVKLPPTRSRYREYYQQRDEQSNPYKPTYTFPEELDGDLKRMEDYIRRAASESLDDDDDDDHNKNISSSPARTSITNVKDHQTIPNRTYFDGRLSTPINSSTDQTKLNNNTSSSTITINPKSNPPPNQTIATTNDDEQKSIYKKILRGGDIPTSGLQKISINNREKSNEDNYTDSNQQKSSSQTNDSQAIYKALALYNFHAQTNKELPFKKGDTIFVKRQINDDWLEGECQGKTGIFPVIYVELLPSEINEEGEAIVKYDYIPDKLSELQLRKGDKVVLLRKLDNNWYEGRLNHLKGIFPGDYVEIIRKPNLSKQSNENENISKTTKNLLKNSPELQQTSVEKMNIVPELTLPKQKCQVLYDYTPQNPDELEIHVGDIISIIEMCDDGWYCGVIEKSAHEKNMSFGTFPGNYVKILPI